MEKAIICIEYDETLVSPEFMAEHVAELEGVAATYVQQDY